MESNVSFGRGGILPPGQDRCEGGRNVVNVVAYSEYGVRTRSEERGAPPGPFSLVWVQAAADRA